MTLRDDLPSSRPLCPWRLPLLLLLVLVQLLVPLLGLPAALGSQGAASASPSGVSATTPSTTPDASAAWGVERLEIVSRELLEDGRPFGAVGPYERLEVVAHLALDPEAPENAGVVDLKLAPRSPDGRVRYRSDLLILRPAAKGGERGSGRGALLVDIPNRGQTVHPLFNFAGASALAPEDQEQLPPSGDGFLFEHGFSVVAVGWQWDPPDRGPGTLRLHPPRAVASPGTGEAGETGAIRGRVRADLVPGGATELMGLGHWGHTPYPPVDPDEEDAVLTVRDAPTGPRREIPRDRWRFVASPAEEEDGSAEGDAARDGARGAAPLEAVPLDAAPLDAAPIDAAPLEAVHLEGGFEAGRIYEVIYTAEAPAVAGLGFTAVRDVAAYLKHHPESPVAVDRALAFGASQTGRFLRHFLHEGWNRDLTGRPALDGVFATVAGAGRGSFNHRFAQASRADSLRLNFAYPTDRFPFAGAEARDPITGETGSLLARARRDGVVPRIIQLNTGAEYWGRGASLIHTAPAHGGAENEAGELRDLPPAPEERIYHVASAPHFPVALPAESGFTAGGLFRLEVRWPMNPAQTLWTQRALLLALDRWVGQGIEPPSSRLPRIADGTLVPVEELEHPDLPGLEGPVEVPRDLYRPRAWDYGPALDARGVIERQPPGAGEPYPVRVPAVDGDGHELGGVRLPQIQVPVATYTPWNFRAETMGASQVLAEFVGAFFPLARTDEEARAAGDPRPSLEERYGSREAYLGRYAGAALELVEEGFLLPEDVPAVLRYGERLWDLVMAGEAVAGEAMAGEAVATP